MAVPDFAIGLKIFSDAFRTKATQLLDGAELVDVTAG
jgi:hypothetical protein